MYINPSSPSKLMAAKRKATTKKDLESKIAELEAKLSKLSSQLEAPKPAETKPAETKPAETKPAESPKPEDAPKPAETTTQPPVTVQEALENAYMNAPMTDFHQYRAKVTGYTPAPNRYFVRLTAPVGKVPTSNWNDQKVKVTGYTQPSNQYFATRARLAYHPTDKRFGSFSGVNLSVEGVEIKEQTPEPPTPSEVTQQAPPSQSSSSGNAGNSKKQSLEEYEAEYMKRLADEQRANEELMRAAAELRAKRQAESQTSSSQSTRGSLPKGF
jgi:hypothetical protein